MSCHFGAKTNVFADDSLSVENLAMSTEILFGSRLSTQVLPARLHLCGAAASVKLLHTMCSSFFII